MGEAGTGPDRRAEKAHLSPGGAARRSAMQTQKRFAVRQNARAPCPDSAPGCQGWRRRPQSGKTPEPPAPTLPCAAGGRPAALQSNRPRTFWPATDADIRASATSKSSRPSTPPPPPPTTNAGIRASATSKGASRAVNSYGASNPRQRKPRGQAGGAARVRVRSHGVARADCDNGDALGESLA